MHQERPTRAANRASQKPRWLNDADCSTNQKNLLMSGRQTSIRLELIRPADPKREQTRLYLRHADALISAFDSFVDNDRFYFIELGLDMTYYLGGMPIRLAEPPYHLGTIIRNSLENPDLFGGVCPGCGRMLYAHSFNGSPLSGRVDLSFKCPGCGWNRYLMVSGWKVRHDALQKTQKEDRLRLLKAKVLNPGFHAAGIRELLDYVGIPVEGDPFAGERAMRKKLRDGETIIFNPDGSVIRETDR